MTADEFNNLSLDAKAELVWENSELIDIRAMYNKSYIELFKVPDFYVEIFYDVEKNEIQKISTTTEAEVLENYYDLSEVYLTNAGVRPPEA